MGRTRSCRGTAATTAAGLVVGLVVGLVAVLGLVGCRPEEVVAPVLRGPYVALGDSYAAGPGIPTTTGQPLGCGRSSNGYPALVAAGGRYSTVRNVTCGGARIRDLTGTQVTRAGDNPPQLGALTPDTHLVTLTIGGNDVGFAEIVARCLDRSSRQPNGSACRDSYTRGGRDVLAGRVAAVGPPLARALTAIRKAAPQARILVVGYLTILPDDTAGCADAPFSAGDAAYLRGVFRGLNGVLEREAEAAGADYVDVASVSAGHDVCAAPDQRWVEGLHPSSPAAPFHPNATGMNATAAHVRGAAALS